MIDIAALVPHAGAMCLLDTVVRHDAGQIHCTARSHLHPGNPLRRGGRLGAVCGVEYGMQAAALHGALRAGARRPAGLAAALRNVSLHADRLDDPGHGVLHVRAVLEGWSDAGSIYVIAIEAETGAALVSARATVLHPAVPTTVATRG